jgi:tripartite-type tricarboxylate transporter receptor subunit TctC
MKPCAAVFALALGAAPAPAQTFPVKPIRLMVPFEPGSLGVDYAVRQVTPKMSEGLGQPVVIENRPGANGMIGAEVVARAAPDGYTLLFTTPSTHITSVFLPKKMPFDPVKDFTPITAAVEPATCIVVHASVPAGNAREFLEHAKRNPGKLSYGSAGIGSTYHFAAERLKQAAELDMFHVPYKSAPSALTAVVSGQIQVSFTTLASAMPHARAGKVRILGVLERTRHPRYPDVPAVSETVPAFEKPASWFGFFGPGGLPQPVLARLNAEIVKALNAPEVRLKYEEAAMFVIGNTPEQFAASITRGYEVYGKAAKAAGVRPE